MTVRTVRTDIMPGIEADCRVVREVDLDGVRHFIICTREEPAPKIYGVRDERQVKAMTTDLPPQETGHVDG